MRASRASSVRLLGVLELEDEDEGEGTAGGEGTAEGEGTETEVPPISVIFRPFDTTPSPLPMTQRDDVAPHRTVAFLAV